MTKPVTFTKATIRRAVEGVTEAGYGVRTVEIDREGRIRVSVTEEEDRGPNPCDVLLDAS